MNKTGIKVFTHLKSGEETAKKTEGKKEKKIVGRDLEIEQIDTCLNRLYDPYITLIGNERVGKKSIVEKYEQHSKKQGITINGQAMNALFRNGAPFYEYVRTVLAAAKKDGMFIVISNGEVLSEPQILSAFSESGVPTVFLSTKNNAPKMFKRMYVKPLENKELYEIGNELVCDLEKKYKVVFSEIKEEIIQLAISQDHTYGQPTGMIEMLENIAIEASDIKPYERTFDANFPSEEAQKRFSREPNIVTYDVIEKVIVKQKPKTKIEGIYGQDEILEKINKQIQKKQLGLYDEKPLTMFFAGPTGVGKTESAKKIAEMLGMEFLRVDMTTMNTEHSISRLIGSPPGYVGSQEGGLITNKLETTSKVVMVFDEVEKAHPKIMDAVLIPIGEGKFQSGRGDEYDCRDAIVIFTSNIGAAEEKSVGFSKVEKTLTERTENSILSHFRPEFIGRVDEVFVYNPLTKEAMRQIAIDEIDKICQKAKVKLTNISELAEEIVNASNERYGAREVKRKSREIAGDQILNVINK